MGFDWRENLALAPGVLVMSLIIFVTARLAGDPRTHLLSETASRQDYEELGRRLGLDQPLPVQYGIFLPNSPSGTSGRP